jgi:hypothetical protein
MGGLMKKNLFRIVFILLVFIIIACASSVPIKQNVENISYPALNTITINNIGDILLSQGVLTTYPAIEIMNEISAPGLVGRGSIVKGIYIGVSKEGNDTIYKPRPNDAMMTEAVGVFFLAGSDDALNVAWRGGFGNLVKGKRIDVAYYKTTTAAIETSSDFQQTLIYTGKEGNIIKATYREYSGNLARPAFTVDVTYDLKDSDIIAFRGARLQILEATNTSIKYKVLSNFK